MKAKSSQRQNTLQRHGHISPFFQDLVLSPFLDDFERTESRLSLYAIIGPKIDAWLGQFGIKEAGTYDTPEKWRIGVPR